MCIAEYNTQVLIVRRKDQEILVSSKGEGAGWHFKEDG